MTYSVDDVSEESSTHPKTSIRDIQLMVVHWAHDTFGYKRNLGTISKKLGKEIQEMQENIQGRDYSDLGQEVADVQILLLDLCFLLDIDVEGEILKKLNVNKARKWEIQPDGTSQHTKEEPNER